MKKIALKLKSLQVNENVHRVVDEDGNDVTPQPFVDPFTKIKSKPPPSMYSSHGSIAKSPSFPGSERSGEMHTTTHSESLQGSARFDHLFLTAKIDKEDVVAEEETSPPMTEAGEGAVAETLQVYKLILKETSTMWHLELPSTTVPEDAPEADKLKEEIERYNWLTEGKGKNRKRVDAETQTLNMPAKRKATMTTPIETKSVHTFVSAWDIYDTYEKTDECESSDGTDGRMFNDAPESDFAITDVESFLHSAMILERMLASNNFRHQQALYTGFPPEPDHPDPTSRFQYELYPLWIYQSAVTKGRAVISLSWNSVNKDILAVGYGQWLVTDEVRSGLVCCWSIKNPANPERSFAQTRPVSCVSFSHSRPHLLAIASLDGNLSLVDVASPSRKPSVIPSSEGRRHHYGPVWGLQWTSEWGEHRGRELLVSTGDDGQVLRWTLEDVLHSIDGTELSTPLRMMCVDATPGSTGLPASDEPVQRVLSGLGLELCLHASPPTLHVATKEGYIVEVEAEMQVRRSRKAHCGPVFTVQASPYCPQLVMTAGAEGTVSMWTTATDQPLLSLQVSEEAVIAAAWSPSHSTVLATISGRDLCLWDIARRTHAPISSVTLPCMLSALAFCPAGRNVLAGDRMGSVHVYNLQDMPYAPCMQLEALVRVIPSLKSYLVTTDDGHPKYS